MPAVSKRVSPEKKCQKHVSTWVGDDNTSHDISPEASIHGQKTKVFIKPDFLEGHVVDMQMRRDTCVSLIFLSPQPDTQTCYHHIHVYMYNVHV